MNKVKNATSAVLLLALVSCTHQQAYVASGESLVALGETFVATGAEMDAALDAKKVTPEQYRKWATFARYFKVTFDVACDRWLHADETAAQHASVVLGALAAELAVYSAVALKGGP